MSATAMLASAGRVTRLTAFVTLSLQLDARPDRRMDNDKLHGRAQHMMLKGATCKGCINDERSCLLVRILSCYYGE